MPRRIPQSAKKHKEKLLVKRAVKRGDLDPESVAPKQKRKKRSRAVDNGAEAPSASSSKAVAVRKLQSVFSALTPALLERSKVVAFNVPLARPVPAAAALFPVHSGRLDAAVEAELSAKLTCLLRPKWRHTMTKTEVESNEEGVFKKWLAQADGIVEDWVNKADEEREHARQVDPNRDPDIPLPEFEADKMPFSPTIFERNIEVWRQLWRVTELSQILLILVDSRCPLLHLPPSVRALFSSPRYRVILVLTKVDIVGQERAEAWRRYLLDLFPSVRVVMMESYIAKTLNNGESATDSKARYRPYVPQNLKESLVSAMKDAHEELLLPPESVKSHPDKLAKWRSPVKSQVDWNALLTADPTAQSVHPGAGKGKEPQSDDETADPEFVTVGLIGQPNVGKSSLLNALFGTTKVRASSTPGKTKHFQTLFWTNEVRLVDCPGLIFPSLVPLELQVLSGILPIARMPAVALCVFYAGQLLPLEQALQLEHPSTKQSSADDKRTWRGGARRSEAAKEHAWTALDVLEAYAEKKGWLTAKAGRPDVNRAGNAILRFLADGKITWAFLPPGTDESAIAGLSGQGIWIDGHGDLDDDESDDGEDADVREDEGGEGSQASTPVSDGSDEESEEEDSRPQIGATATRFALLDVESDGEEDSEGDDTGDDGK